MSTTAPDPDADKLALTVFDLLLIELVPLAQRIATDLAIKPTSHPAHHSLQSHSTQATKTLPDRTSEAGNATAGSLADTGTTGLGGLGFGGAETGSEEEEAMKEQVFWRLDSLGYRVGQGLVERYATSPPTLLNLSTHSLHPFLGG
jgi:hypothetical protein